MGNIYLKIFYKIWFYKIYCAKSIDDYCT